MEAALFRCGIEVAQSSIRTAHVGEVKSIWRPECTTVGTIKLSRNSNGSQSTKLVGYIRGKYDAEVLGWIIELLLNTELSQFE
jgi:hypothetical protein